MTVFPKSSYKIHTASIYQQGGFITDNWFLNLHEYINLWIIKGILKKESE